jgi:hypothetical protein
MRSLGRGIAWHLSLVTGSFAAHRVRAAVAPHAAGILRTVKRHFLGGLLLALAAAPAAQAATPSQTDLLRRHAPLLVLDAREPSGPVSVDPFLRGARGARAQATAPRVYGHAVRDDGRLWLQYWFFYPDNPQDRGIVRTGRHEGDWEMLQIGLGRADEPEVVTFAQHHWRQGCTWADAERQGNAPVAYASHASHATYPRRGEVDRPWPDPNDDVRGDGIRVRPPVSVITDTQPSWVASRMHWGASRARWWIPSEHSSPPGPRFQDDGRWDHPAAYHDGARACTASPPGHPWFVNAIVALAALLAVSAAVRIWRERPRA